MIRRNSNPAPLAGLCALAAWVLCALLCAQAAARTPGPAVFWPEGEGISPAQLLRSERYAKEDGAQALPTTLLWKEKKGNADRADGRGSAAATFIQAVGDPALGWPAGFLYGGWPARGDTQGCAVSHDVAAALWGGTDVVGQALEYDGTRYYVRGVFQSPEGMVVLQASPDGSGLFNRLLLRLPEGGREEASAWLSRSGFPQGTVLDLPLLSWCLSALAGLPALLLGLCLLGRLAGRVRALRFSPLLLLQFIPLALALAAAALWASGFPWDFPARLIPGRWSDFSFWSGLAVQWAHTLRACLSLPLTSWDLDFWGRVLGCLILAPLGAACALLWTQRASAPTVRALYLGVLGHLGALFLLSLACAAPGGAPPTRGMWLLPPLWLAADRCLSLHETALLPAGERSPAHEIPPPPNQIL